MSSESSFLDQPGLIVVFASAPTGLGHLRVTEALYQGLPKSITPTLLGAQDRSLTFLHRLTSIHPVMRSIFEWGQQEYIEDLFVDGFRQFLISRTELIYRQLTTILDQRVNLPNTVLVIATHFALAHQLAAIKERVQKEKDVRMILAVQVTDDSPQHIWFVPDADITFVPSIKTRTTLEKYARKKGYANHHIEVTPYPVSPLLSKNLAISKYENRIRQLQSQSQDKIHIAIPISGAAVGLEYMQKIIEGLHEKSDRFHFHVISKITNHTTDFLDLMAEHQYVNLYTSTHDRAVIDKYEQVYLANTIALEITKPSEQAFKTLMDPTHHGGPIILFSQPVGRQEYDNVDFLHRHNFIPHQKDTEYLWRVTHHAQENREIPYHYIHKAKQWRGIQIPINGDDAHDFIWQSLKQGLFESMIEYKNETESSEETDYETRPDGVHEFWKKLIHFLEESS